MPRNHQINDSMASSSLFLLFLFYKLNRIIIHILINHFLPWRFDLRCFPLELKRQPSRYQNFEAQSHSLFSRCLRLATTITGSHPRLATGGWLDLTRQAFHLLDYSPLSGRTIPIYLSVLNDFFEWFPWSFGRSFIGKSNRNNSCQLAVCSDKIHQLIIGKTSIGNP